MFPRLKMTQYSQNFNHKEPNGQFWKPKFGVKRFKWNHFFVMANLSSFEKLLWCCHFTHVEAHFPTCFFHFPSMQIPSLTFTVWHHLKVLCRQVSFKTTPSSILLYDMCPNLIFRSLFDAPSPEFLMSIIFFLHFFFSFSLLVIREDHLDNFVPKANFLTIIITLLPGHTFSPLSLTLYRHI